MKPTEGYVYQIDGKIVCNEREMPSKDHYKYHLGKKKWQKYYNAVYKSWLKSCKDVVNAEIKIEKVFVPAYSEAFIETICLNNKKIGSRFTQGQKVLKVPEGDKVRIVELK